MPETNEPDEANLRRLKWYGTNDYGTYFQTDRAAEVLAAFESGLEPASINDLIELYHAREFALHGILPRTYTEELLELAKEQGPRINAQVGRYCGELNSTNLNQRFTDLYFDYQSDLLQLLARFGVMSRVAAAPLLDALNAAGLHVRQLLLSRTLVHTFDTHIRGVILSDPRNAELIMRKQLVQNQRQEVHLPPSLSTADSHGLIDAYVDLDDPNPNFLQLIANSAGSASTAAGIDTQLRLKAKRKLDAATKAIFAGQTGFRFGCEVSIEDDQAEPVEASIDGTTAKYSYSTTWMEENLDYATILNNFIHLFEYASQHVLLTLPSFTADLGVFERLLEVPGVTDYRVGSAFRLKDQLSFLQLVIYDRFLKAHDVQLEEAIAWFFDKYMTAEFGAAGFRFLPSSPTATYLERCRHLFAEMESVTKQFLLYVENGAIDPDLLAMTDQFRYRTIPSLVEVKYVYAQERVDFQNVMHLLFSDQSSLNYISETLSGDNMVALLVQNELSYADFEIHQHAHLDYLVAQGILVNTGQRIAFANLKQILILKELSEYESIAYHHYSAESVALIDSMISRGWLRSASTLFADAEASYFNFYLNNSEFGNGPALRNSYAHGTPSTDEEGHFKAYVVALRLIICLILKINDDLGAHFSKLSTTGAGESSG